MGTFSFYGAAAAPGGTLTPTVTEYTGGVAQGFSANSGPFGITSGPDGNLWFAEDAMPGRIARFTLAGAATEFTGGVTPGFTVNAGPTNITVGRDGNLWFTEDGNVEDNPSGVARITPGGTVTELLGGVTPGFSPKSGPLGITVGPNGNLWFAEFESPGHFAQILPSGDVNEHTGGLAPGFSKDGGPWGITMGPDGNVWLAEEKDPGRIARISPALAVTEFTGGVTPGFSANRDPEYIAVGSDGNLWFTEDADPGGIGQITPSGVVTEFTGGMTPGFTAGAEPEQIVAGPDGALWFTEFADPGGIGRITTSGVVTEFRAGATSGFSAGGFPEGITVGPDGNIWFTETGDPGRVARLTTPPVATTGDANAVRTTSVRLAAVVNGHAQRTSAHFEVGPAGGARRATPEQDIGSGAADTPVSADVTNLSPGTTYEYDVVATNGTGTTTGAVRTFDTAEEAPRIIGLRVKPRSLRAGGRATISYVDSKAAATSLRFFRLVRRAKRVRAGTLRHADRAGANRIRFGGRLRGHRLPPGRYQLQAQPTFHGLIGTTVTTSFKVRRGR